MDRQVRPGQESAPELRECPQCQWKSLFCNSAAGLYECLNPNCKSKFRQVDMLPANQLQKGEATSENVISFPSSTREWIISWVLIFALSLYGLIVSLVVRNPIPLWVLFIFALIFSVERWYSHYTIKYKEIGILYRILLNFSILSSLGFLIWSGVQLFSKKLTFDPLLGSYMFLVELAYFVWLWIVVSKNSWRRPSMKLTIFCLIVLFVVFGFAGVEPFQTYIINLGATYSNIIPHRSN